MERRFTLDSLRNGAGSWQPNETEAETEAEQEPDTETHNTTSTDMSPAHHGIGQRDEWSPAGSLMEPSIDDKEKYRNPVEQDWRMDFFPKQFC